MSRIQDVTRALRDAKRAYERIMKRKRYTNFYTNEVYAPGHSEAQGKEPCNTLAACDNLAYMEYLLKEKDMAGKIQLIYVDPPFFSNSKYQVSVRLESDKLGKSPTIRTGAYDDTWEDSLQQYLTMLGVRFYLMKELLADTGCLWVHLDWHSSHYMKILLDEIFGYDNFINEVAWTYKSGGASKRSFARKHDTLLFYCKTSKYKFHPLKEKSYNRDLKPYRFKDVEEFEDDLGWYTMVNMKDVWTIDMVGRTSSERTGYATQKPEKLLERIVEACSDEGDLCADFFAGSGTPGVVCENMKRRWIMCDEGEVSVSNQIRRFMNAKMADDRRFDAFAVVRTEKDPDEALSRLVRCGEEMGCLRIYDYVPDVLKLSDADEEIALQYLHDDSRSVIDFWSLDADYDGHVHRANEIIKGNDFCTLPEGKLHVIGYDVFGNRFCWEETEDI
ncbi:MAG: site-specific DNA-methyltransferase [Firmicutes bacterium]|nr:site-specific DNA-methyltransferase [Bacillota bacterium]